MNRALLIGNLTRDPELRMTRGGSRVCSLSIAINRPYSNMSGERETDFLTVVCWNDLADLCGKYLKKGQKIAVCGMVQSRRYETSSGESRTVVEIVANEIEFLTPKKQGNQSNEFDDMPF